MNLPPPPEPLQSLAQFDPPMRISLGSPDIHPTVLSTSFFNPLRAPGFPSRLLAAGSDILDSIQRGRLAIDDAEKAAWASVGQVVPPTSTPPGKVLQMMRTVSGERYLQWGFESELAASARRIAARTEAQIADPMKIVAGAPLVLRRPIEQAFAVAAPNAEELRDFLLRRQGATTPSTRMEFVMTRIAANDRQLLLAILGASPYLSGLTDEQPALLRAHAEKTWFPVELAQLTAADSLIARIDSAREGMALQVERILLRFEAAGDATIARSQAFRTAEQRAVKPIGTLP